MSKPHFKAIDLIHFSLDLTDISMTKTTSLLYFHFHFHVTLLINQSRHKNKLGQNPETQAVTMCHCVFQVNQVLHHRI